MAFGKKYKPRKIKIESASVDNDSPAVQKRLDRIARNYQKLDEVFNDLETRIELDERLTSDKENFEPPKKPR